MDYYCFPTITGDISVFFESKPYLSATGRFFYQITQKNIMLAKQIGKLLLFDLRTQTFIDLNGNTINIKGKEIFPRCRIQESELLLNAIEKHGGNSIVTNADSKIVENWFEHINVQRKFLKTTFGEVLNNLDFYRKKYGNKFFLKTIKKQFANICHIIQTGDYYNLFSFIGRSFFGGNLLIYDNSTPVILTDAVNIVKDNYGKREWRVFVVKNKIWCISRISDDLVNIEPYIIEKIQRKINQLSEISIFPSSYSVDFFEYDNNGEIIFDICEFNPIESSGTYQNNNLVF